MRTRTGLPSLRRPSICRLMVEAIASASRDGFQVIQFSIQRDHIHLLVEARDARSLSSGARGLAVRTARRLNRHLCRAGNVWAVRYHTHALRTPTEVRNALVYVLMNIKKHSEDACDGLDPCSSAPWFDGFAVPLLRRDHQPAPVCPPQTWLAAHGWKRRGLIHPREYPRSVGSRDRMALCEVVPLSRW